jgi:hypothetical protein
MSNTGATRLEKTTRSAAIAERSERPAPSGQAGPQSGDTRINGSHHPALPVSVNVNGHTGCGYRASANLFIESRHFEPSDRVLILKPGIDANFHVYNVG